jgi:hypothetical protein
MSTKTIDEVKELLRNDDTQVGETFRLIEQESLRHLSW